MAEARQTDAWERTSWLLAKIHNVHCAKVSEMISPINPMRPGRRHAGRCQQVDGAFNVSMHDALAAAEAAGH